MKVFLDANVIMEYLGKRKFYDSVSNILRFAYQTSIDACISASIVDNVVYLLGIHLKKEGIQEPEKRNTIRMMLIKLLSYIDVIDISQSSVLQALSDENFKDLEDSLQYHCALENNCDCVVTINTKDFPLSNDDIEVLSPLQFVDKYLDID